jgi:hypothetical protein
MVKVTITTFFLYTNVKHFLKQEWDKKLRKELIRLLSFEGQPAKAVLAQICISVFIIC